MKPSDKQNLEREKLDQQMKKQSAAWVLTQEVVEMESPEEKDLREANEALKIIRMFPTRDTKQERSTEKRKRKIRNERRERKEKRRIAQKRAREYVGK
ncbi:hypothetical protein KAR91_67220 [Candidatus Pacearchaeota archaeon]|nr:hypothetical protein [Candidatus Pacearchaeota archaeon]